MFFPEGQVRVFLYGQPVNMRLSFDGLYALAKHDMHKDRLSGHLFAFINRRATQVRVLYFDPRRDLENPTAREDRERIYGVDKRELEGAGPSVVSLNGIIASLSVTEFIMRVTGMRPAVR